VHRSGSEREPIAPLWRAVAVTQDARHRLDLEAGELQHLPEPAAVEDEPLAAVPAGIESGERRRKQRQRPAHGLEHDQMPPTHAADGLEPTERVSQHLQDVAHDDHVELTDLGGVEVVGTQVEILRT
jgi:hypothetical protein